MKTFISFVRSYYWTSLLFTLGFLNHFNPNTVKDVTSQIFKSSFYSIWKAHVVSFPTYWTSSMQEDTNYKYYFYKVY